MQQVLAPKLRESLDGHSRSKYEFRGVAFTLQTAQDREIVLTGATRTGKSLAALYKLHRCALKYPGFRGLIIRKTRESLNESGLLTFERDVLGSRSSLLSGARRASRHSYIYPNGAEIVVGGLVANGRDQIAKIMSTEYDMIFAQECTELAETEWQQLLTRLSNYRMPYQQIIGDCNPNVPTHWVRRRSLSKRLLLWEMFFHDNPRWWVIDELDLSGEGGHWTTEGMALMANLKTLTGLSRQRLVLAQWVQAEGAIFNEVWDESRGSISEGALFEKDAGEIYWAADDGYSAGSAALTGGRDAETGYYAADAHPRVFLVCQLKPDGHIDVLCESYACLKLTDDHIAEVLALPKTLEDVQTRLQSSPLHGDKWLEANPNKVTQVREVRDMHPDWFYDEPTIVSFGPGSAEFRGRLYAAQLVPHQCTERVDTSLQELRSWLSADANTFRRIRVNPSCVNLRMQMVEYSTDEATQKPRKAFDDGPDALRGLVWVLRGMVNA